MTEDVCVCVCLGMRVCVCVGVRVCLVMSVCVWGYEGLCAVVL